MTDTTRFISHLFARHGLEASVEGEWVLPNSQLPALRALWSPGPQSGRLDVQAMVQEKLVVEECFAGMGAGEAGLQDALTNFTLNSFHVMLAALWGHEDREHVSTERWTSYGKPYIAYIGNFGTRASAGVSATIPPKLLGEIANAIQAESLTEDLHWFRLFYCGVEGEHTFEALKDNSEWPAGKRSLRSVEWDKQRGYYSVRLFVMLKAA